MSPRRSSRHLLVAVLLGVLVGGGLMAVTPAGAQVNEAVATSWKKIWKKEIRPRADRRYYTKAQGDAKYQAKGSYETAGSGYSKAETWSRAEADARYAGAGSSYTKGESDTRYAPYPSVIRGTFIQVESTGTFTSEDISYGVTLNAAPTAHIIQPGGVVPAGCAGGTVASPNALPGNLCVFLRYNSADTVTANTSTLLAGSGTFGTLLLASRAAAGYLEISGSWAVRPSGLAPSAAKAPADESGSRAPATEAR